MPDETNIERLKFDKEILDNRVKQYDIKCKMFYVIISCFCCICIAFLLISWLFFGSFSVFDIKFSIPSIITWLDNLPFSRIKHPTVQLIRLYIGIAFFIAYLIITVLLIVYFIKALSRFVTITDIKNTRINHKALTFDIMFFTTKSFRATFALMLISFLTLPDKLCPLSVATFVIYALYYLFTNAVIYLYAYYDVKKGYFNKKHFFISLIKSFLLLSLSYTLVFLTLDKQIYSIVESLRLVLYVTPEIPTILKIEIFGLAALSGWIYLEATKIFRKIMKYHSNYLSDEYSISYFVNNLSIRIMVFSSIYYTAIFVFCFIDGFGYFYIPQSDILINKALPLFLSLTSRTLLAVAIKIISQIKERYITKLNL